MLMLISRLPLYIRIAEHMSLYMEFVFLFLAGTIASSAISLIAHKFIEKPGQDLGRYLSKKIIG